MFSKTSLLLKETVMSRKWFCFVLSPSFFSFSGCRVLTQIPSSGISYKPVADSTA